MNNDNNLSRIHYEEGLDGDVLITRPVHGDDRGRQDAPVRARRSGSFGIFVVCLVFGFLLSIQFKSVDLSETTQANNQLMRVEEIQTLLNKERLKNQELYEELLQYKDDVAGYREQALASGDYVSVVAKELERAELAAGMTDLVGPGVAVTLSDAPRTTVLDPEIDANLYIIHDEDLLRVINVLRGAGAEAISINGERVVATSEVNCIGPVVSVNGNRYAPPYVIRAIGDPGGMYSALTMLGGAVDLLTMWNIQVDIQQVESHVIKAYTGKTTFKYAKEYSADAGSGG